MTFTDFAPFLGSVGGGFIVGALAGYAIKKVMKIAAIIVGLLIAALAYLEYTYAIILSCLRYETSIHIFRYT